MSKTGAINQLIDKNNGYVPIKRSQVYGWLKKYKEGNVTEDDIWGNVGCPVKCAIPDVVTQVLETNTNGKSTAQSQVRELIINQMRDQWVARGNAAYTFKEPGRESYRRWEASIMSHPKLNVFKKVNTKTKTRHTAEWSIRSTICYTMAVAVAHWIIGPSIPRLHKKDEEMSAGARMLKMLVMLMNGGANMIHALAGLVTSTDETTLFVFEGTIPGKESFYLVAKPDADSAKPDSSQRSTYNEIPQDDSHKRGLRVRLNTTYADSGEIAPIFAIVYGLSINEMPGVEDIYTLEIPGLAIGADQNPMCQVAGYVVFVRGHEKVYHKDNDTEEGEDLPAVNENDEPRPPSKETRVARIYREKVYYPFINQIRKARYQWDESTPVPPHLFAVSWQDGAYGQIRALVDEESLKRDDEERIMNCKHSAARTVVEQSADVGPTYRSTKHYQRVLEVDCCSGLMRCVGGLLLSLRLKNIIVFEPAKENALCEFLAKLPKIMRSSMTVDDVQKGFLGNGQIDADSKSVPDLFNLIGTYRGEIDDSEEMYYENIFKTFYDVMSDNGHIDESVFDDNDIPLDMDSDGTIVLKNFGIAGECRQRAKILSSGKQRDLRRELLDKIESLKREAQQKQYDREQKIFLNAKKCLAKVLGMILPNQDGSANSFSNVAEANFGLAARKGYPTMDELKAFAKVRLPRRFDKKGNPTYNTLGKLKRREDLVKRCFDLRGSTILVPHLKAPPTPANADDEDVEIADEGDEEIADEGNVFGGEAI